MTVKLYLSTGGGCLHVDPDCGGRQKRNKYPDVVEDHPRPVIEGVLAKGNPFDLRYCHCVVERITR